MRLSAYQKKVLCAIRALHGLWHDYVTSEAIAWVVSPHSGIRGVTLQLLEELGLICCQADDLPFEVKQLLMCGCHQSRYRLTEAAAELIDGWKYVIDEATEERIESSGRLLARMREWAQE
jgi:hypothetical protein